MNEKQLVPKLRFSGFDENWVKETLGNLVKINSGKSPKNLVDPNGKYPYFKVEQLNNCNKYLIETPYFINDNSLLIKQGSLIFPKRGMAIMANKIRLLVKDSFMDTNLMTLTTKANLINNEFLFYFLTNEELSRLADTTSVPQLNNKHINPYIIYIPTIKEQEKIANFLSIIDNKIELLEQKYKSYVDFKKFLMQQIFAQKLRFADYSEYTLKQISEKIENGFTGKQVSYETPFPVTRIETISSGKINYDKVGFVDEIPERYLLKEGDVLLTNINSMKWIGNSVYYDGKKILYHGMNLMLLRSKNEINSKYLYYYITYNNNWFKKMACQAVNQASINKSTLEKFIVKIPDIETQNNIANLLSFADEKIREISNQVDLTMKFKKGLLQQMFV